LLSKKSFIMDKEIHLGLSIEEVIEICPEAVKWLSERDVVCVVCGEPVWDSLGGVISKKGFSDEQALRLLKELKQLCKQKDF